MRLNEMIPDDTLMLKVGQLQQVRTILLKLHKSLLDLEKDLYEARYGRIGSPNEFFKLVLEAEEFMWLRTFSKLIVEIDEAIASKRDPITLEKAIELVELSRATLQPSPIGHITAQRYYIAIERDSTIARMHLQVHEILQS